MPLGGSTSGLDWGSLMMMISRNGRGGLGLSWLSHMTCSFITLGAGRSLAMALMPTSCSMRTRRGLRPNGGIRCQQGEE